MVVDDLTPSTKTLTLAEMQEMCPQGVIAVAGQGGYVNFHTDVQPTPEMTQARNSANAFIDKTSNPFYYSEAAGIDNTKEGEKIFEYERDVFKFHLKVPLDLKTEVLETVLSNKDRLNFPDFKMYFDHTEAREDAKYPGESVASFVFYFDNIDPSILVSAAQVQEFMYDLHNLLVEKGIYEKIPEDTPLPRYSFQAKLRNGEKLNGFSVVQGDGDFKNRSLFGYQDIVLDKESQNAFFCDKSMLDELFKLTREEKTLVDMRLVQPSFKMAKHLKRMFENI